MWGLPATPVSESPTDLLIGGWSRYVIGEIVLVRFSNGLVSSQIEIDRIDWRQLLPREVFVIKQGYLVVIKSAWAARAALVRAASNLAIEVLLLPTVFRCDRLGQRGLPGKTLPPASAYVTTFISSSGCVAAGRH